MTDEGRFAVPIKTRDGDIGPSARSRVILGVERLYWAARLVFFGVLIAAPWLFGGSEYIHQSWLYSGVLLSAVLWLVAFGIESVLLPGASPAVIPTLMVPLIGALLLGGVQLIPDLPTQWPRLERLGSGVPARPEIDVNLGLLAPSVAKELSSRRRFSIYPASTRLEITRLTVGTAAFLLGVVLFRRPFTQRLLWGLLALNGAALACFGILQKLSWNGKIYWTYPMTWEGQPFAAFINRNNAAGYLNLCFGAALGFATWIFWKPSAATRMQRMAKGLPDRTPWHARQWREIEVKHAFAVLLCVLTFAGVCCSLSRGGSVAAGLASVACLILLARRRGAAIAFWAAFGGIILSGALMAWLGLSAGFTNRLSTLLDEETVTTNARLTNWADARRAFHDFPVIGSGLGTYRYAYQPYQTQPSNAWFYNADNQYIEGLVEGGSIGAFLVGACVALILLAFWKVARSGSDSSSDALLYVGLFAIVSQLSQTATDFGISVPANLMTFATICGVLAAEAAHCDKSRPPSVAISWPVWSPRLVLAILAAGIVCIGALGVEDVANAAVAKGARLDVPKLTGPDALNETRLAKAIGRMEQAVSRRGDDAELCQSLAELLIYQYRQKTYQAWKVQWVNSEKKSQPPVWNSTGLSVLHKLANEVYSIADANAVSELRQYPLIRDNLPIARRHLLAAQAACPLLPRVDLQLAMLRFLDAGSPAGMDQIERAVALSPVDPYVLFTAGQLANEAGRFDLTETYWRRSLSLSPQYQSDIVNAALDKLPLAEAVEKIFAPSAPVLLDLARYRFSSPEDTTARTLLVETAQRQFHTGHSTLSSAEKSYWSAVAERLNGKMDAAIIQYEQAVRSDPGKMSWRVELVEAYRDVGRLDEAVAEARRCARAVSPPYGIERLLQELVREQLTRRPSKP